MNESKLDLLTLRSGDFFNLNHLSLLVEQPRKGSWLYQGNTRIATEQDALSIAEGLDAGWVKVPCVVARRGTNQGIPYMIWTRPGDVERVTLHSSGRVSLVATSGRVLISPRSREEIKAILKGELQPSEVVQGALGEAPGFLELLTEVSYLEDLSCDQTLTVVDSGNEVL